MEARGNFEATTPTAGFEVARGVVVGQPLACNNSRQLNEDTDGAPMHSCVGEAEGNAPDVLAQGNCRLYSSVRAFYFTGYALSGWTLHPVVCLNLLAQAVGVAYLLTVHVHVYRTRLFRGCGHLEAANARHADSPKMRHATQSHTCVKSVGCHSLQ